jgi:type II secretory pathway component PulK
VELNDENAAVTHVLRNRRGFVLIAALFLLVVASTLVLQAALRTRVQRGQALRDAERVRARAAAEAGIADALARLDNLEEESARVPAKALDLWNHLSEVEMLRGLEHVQMDHASYSASIVDVGTKLPMNVATAGELSRLFAELGVEPDRADVLVNAILLRRSQPVVGTSDSTSGRFATPAELLASPGVRSQDVGRLTGALSGIGGGHVNLNTAPKTVLRALPGLDDAAIRWILRRRRERPIGSIEELAAALGAGSHKLLMENYFALAQRVTFSPDAVEIIAVGEAGDPVTRSEIHAIAVPTSGGFQVVWEEFR